MADIFREVDEELREDRAKQLWQRYGKFVIAAAFGVVALVAAIVYWDSYQAQQRAAASAKFEQIATMDDVAAQRESLLTFAEDTTQGYAVIAKMRAAGLARQQGDADTALSTYRALVTDANADPMVQDLAAYLAGTILADNGDSAGVDAAVISLTGEGHPLRYAALELQAAAAVASGEFAKARTYLDQIITADDVDDAARTRAAELSAAIDN